MKIKIIVGIIFFLINFSCVEASEIFGKISTNPKNIPLPPPAPQSENKPIKNENIIQGSQAPVGLFPKKTEKTGDNKAEIKVLGIKYFPDYSLLRGLDKKIYITEGQTKKRILDLIELKKYKNKKIFDVNYEELTSYQTRPYLNGELVREKNKTNIFAIEKSAKKIISSLSELRLRYANKKIHEISSDEMKLYPDAVGVKK